MSRVGQGILLREVVAEPSRYVAVPAQFSKAGFEAKTFDRIGLFQILDMGSACGKVLCVFRRSARN